MARRYEQLQSARFQRESVNGIEQIIIPARRSWFLLLFLGFWLAMWTLGGLAALYDVTQSFDLFLIFWLGAWAVGWIFAAAIVAWQINGRETVRVVGGDLEVQHSAIGLSRSWWFRGSHVRDLKASDQPFPFGWAFFDGPFMFWRRWGAVKFRYGARTMYLATALDEAEGAQIVEALRKYLPQAAAQ